MTRAIVLLFGIVFLCTGIYFSASAQGGWPSLFLAKQFSGFNSPVFLTHAGDSSNRIFVVEQEGVIKLIKNGTNKLPRRKRTGY